MSRPTQVHLNKKQVEYIMETSGEKTPKKAFNMFLSAMFKENIKASKMPLLIDKMMAKSEVKEDK